MTLQPETSPGVTPLGKRGTGNYLNPRQFMSMRRVMQMTPMDGAYDMPNLVDMKREEIANGEGDTADYPALEDTMRSDGPTGTDVPPIYNNNNTLANGGHRVSIAHDLGWKAMRYTDDINESGYGDERFPSNDSWDEDNEESSYHSDQSSYHNGDTPEPSAHDPRNHVPGNTGMSGNSQLGRQRGRLWHDPGMAGAPRLGDAGPGPGLYTQLHGPAETHLNEQQFGRTKIGQQNTAVRIGFSELAKQNNVQGTLPFESAPRRPAGYQPGDGVETMRGKFQAEEQAKAAKQHDYRRANNVGWTVNSRGGFSDVKPGADASAPHGRWPGGGKILTGDLDITPGKMK